ncbi:HpcH/HpaI aldolase family protein [Actibacterium pelagium]|uniref:Hydroxypyruvate/pyruvate aldolase n=1 Tax=Actibacterium pelagium TaxID=2029103 RepID=A0A917AJQ9_9RHOB|nr:HpcH/HpaI aldolase/citrate lyase family protein [Actibacterium pelagium]GGE58134.1 4-hydroxy-2-oxo-heptane-1,7-dioate aldolase [Actibacterium pelagium]
MQLRKNRFKEAIQSGQLQLGLWSMTRDPALTEMLAGCGYDWINLDCEHTPNHIDRVLSMLQAIEPYDTEAIVRATHLDPAEIKQLLDAGARNIVIPYVQTVEEAQLAAASVEYPPKGIRGVAGSTRASRFGAVTDYVKTARDNICLIVQIETADAMSRIEEIAAVDGIDAMFIGPADLAASLGHPGDVKHPEVQAAIVEAIQRITAAGKPAGFLSGDQEMLDKVVAAGGLMMGIDIDMILLRRAALERLETCRKWLD